MGGRKGGGQAQGPAPTKTGSPPAVGDGPCAVPNGGWHDTRAVHFHTNPSYWFFPLLCEEKTLDPRLRMSGMTEGGESRMTEGAM